MSYRILGDVTGAEDVAAEAVARALVSWRRVGRLDHRTAWVARVAGNLAIDEIRRARRRRDRPAPALLAAPDARSRATVPPTTRTTLRPTATSTTNPPPLRVCDPADVVVTATPERPSFPVGTTVSVRVAGLNRSSLPCEPFDPTVEFRTAAGAMISGLSLADAFTGGIEGQPRPSWDPGETLSATMPLPALYCGDSAVLCPPGAYTATAVLGPFRSPPAPFTIT